MTTSTIPTKSSTLGASGTPERTSTAQSSSSRIEANGTNGRFSKKSLSNRLTKFFSKPDLGSVAAAAKKDKPGKPKAIVDYFKRVEKANNKMVSSLEMGGKMAKQVAHAKAMAVLMEKLQNQEKDVIFKVGNEVATYEGAMEALGKNGSSSSDGDGAAANAVVSDSNHGNVCIHFPKENLDVSVIEGHNGLPELYISKPKGMTWKDADKNAEKVINKLKKFTKGRSVDGDDGRRYMHFGNTKLGLPNNKVFSTSLKFKEDGNELILLAHSFERDPDIPYILDKVGECKNRSAEDVKEREKQKSAKNDSSDSISSFYRMNSSSENSSQEPTPEYHFSIDDLNSVTVHLRQKTKEHLKKEIMEFTKKSMQLSADELSPIDNAQPPASDFPNEIERSIIYTFTEKMYGKDEAKEILRKNESVYTRPKEEQTPKEDPKPPSIVQEICKELLKEEQNEAVPS